MCSGFTHALGRISIVKMRCEDTSVHMGMAQPGAAARPTPAMIPTETPKAPSLAEEAEEDVLGGPLEIEEDDPVMQAAEDRPDGSGGDAACGVLGAPVCSGEQMMGALSFEYSSCVCSVFNALACMAMHA